MNLIFLLQHAEEATHAAAESPGVFTLNIGTSVWTVVIFLLLLGVLAKFAFPPILGFAAAREARIQQDLDEAKRARAEAAAMIEEHRKQLAEARAQAQQIIAEGTQAADRTRQELLDRARGEQEELLTRTRQEIERERLKAVDSVRTEAVEIALAAASKLISQRLGSDDDRKLVSDYLNRVASDAGAA